MRKTQFRSDLAEVFENVQKTLPLERVPVMSPGGFTKNQKFFVKYFRVDEKSPLVECIFTEKKKNTLRRAR